MATDGTRNSEIHRRAQLPPFETRTACAPQGEVMSRRRPAPSTDRIATAFRRLPARQRLRPRPVDLDLEGMATCLVARMGAAAIAARAGRQRAQEIDLGEEFDEVARPHRA